MSSPLPWVGVPPAGVRARLRFAPLAALVAALLLWLLVTPAAAAASPTLGSAPATGITAAQATLNGTATGYTGTGDYCSFVFAQETGGTMDGSTASLTSFPAQPCDGATATTKVDYSQTVTALGPGVTYWYAAVHCTDVTSSNGQHYCAAPGSGTYPYGWDAIEQCNPYNPSGAYCPSFTTPSLGATTGSATAITGTTATITGTLNLSGDDCSKAAYEFEYSTDPNLTGASATTVSLDPCTGVPTAPVSVSANLTGLSPGTTIYYRLDAVAEETSHQVIQGAIRSFRTSGWVATDAATAISASGATLNGEVDTGNDPFRYSWLYSSSSGTGANGELNAAATTIAGGTVSANTDQTVSASLASLQAGATYYFQLVATDTSTGATVVGQPQALTTLPFGCPSGGAALTGATLSGTGFDISGCVSGHGPWTVHGTAVINGLTFNGPGSSTVVIDPSSQQLTISSGYAIELGTVTLYNTGTGGLAPVPYSTSGGDSTFQLPQVSTADKLFSLTIGGQTIVTAHAAGGAHVKITALGMPIVLGGITAEANIDLNQDGSLGTVKAQLGDSSIGPLTLPGVTLTYDAKQDQWSGDLNMQLPYINKAGVQQAGIDVNLVIKNGKLNGLGGAASWPDPGIPLGETGVVINSIGFSSVFSPLTLQGTLGGALGPEVDGISLLNFNTGFYFGFNQDQQLATGLPGIPDNTTLKDVPFTLGLNGELSLFGVLNLVSSNVDFYDISPWPLLVVQTQIGQPLEAGCGSLNGSIGINPGITLTGDAGGGGFNLEGHGYIHFDLCSVFSGGLDVNTLISSNGGAFCASLLGNSVGIGFTWPSSLADVADVTKNLQLYLSGNCDVGRYVATIATTARAGAGRRVLLPPGLPFAVIRVRGVGGAPFVRVRGPRHLQIVTHGNHGALAHGYLVIPDQRAHTTYVEIKQPVGGVYTIAAERGSVPVRAVATAHGERPPLLHGGVRRSGRGLIQVRWNARRLPSQRIVFTETGAGGARRLYRTGRSRGAFTYRPAAGLRGARTIQADLYEYGKLAKVVKLGRFQGPVLRRPAKPTDVRLRRRGTTLSVSWRARAASYRVLVITGDGRHRLFVARRDRLTLRHGVPRRGTIRVRVTGVNRFGVLGASAWRRWHRSVRRPGRPARLRVVRTGAAVVLSWSPRGLRATSFRVRVFPRRGASRLLTTRRDRLVLPGRLVRRDIVRLMVTAVDRAGRRGPTAVIRLR